MAKTKAQIRDRALQMLGKLAIGQTATGQMATDIESAYDQVYAVLKAKGLATWLGASVPDEFVEDVATLVAFERTEGIPAQRAQGIAIKAAGATLSISANISGVFNNPRGVENY